MIVKNQKPIRFINDCGAIVDYDELEKAIIWYQDKPTSNVKHIYMHGQYPAVSIFKEKIHIHRLLGMYWSQNKDLERTSYVHHEDENKLNASKDNLKIIDMSEHQSMHNIGKTNSQKQIDKLIEFNHTRKNTRQPNKRADVSYKVVWELKQQGLSINAIAKFLNTDWTTIKARLKDIEDNTKLIGEAV